MFATAVGLAAAMPAQASAFGGLLSGLLTFTVALPLSAFSLVLFAVFAVNGAYCSRRLALWHAGLASLAPLAGAIATVFDGAAASEEGVRLLANGLMLALAQLPVLMHLRHAGNNRGQSTFSAGNVRSCPEATRKGTLTPVFRDGGVEQR